jgi:hypothetical protein
VILECLVCLGGECDFVEVVVRHKDYGKATTLEALEEALLQLKLQNDMCFQLDLNSSSSLISISLENLFVTSRIAFVF